RPRPARTPARGGTRCLRGARSQHYQVACSAPLAIARAMVRRRSLAAGDRGTGRIAIVHDVRERARGDLGLSGGTAGDGGAAVAAGGDADRIEAAGAAARQARLDPRAGVVDRAAAFAVADARETDAGDPVAAAEPAAVATNAVVRRRGRIRGALRE